MSPYYESLDKHIQNGRLLPRQNYHFSNILIDFFFALLSTKIQNQIYENEKQLNKSNFIQKIQIKSLFFSNKMYHKNLKRLRVFDILKKIVILM